LITNGLSKENFEATRNFLINYVPQLVASQDKQLGYAMDSAFYGIGEFGEYVTSQLNQLTVEDVNRVIAENLQSENMHYVFITGDGKDMVKRLSQEQSSPLKYNSEKPKALTDEDAIIQDYKLAIPANNIELLDIDAVFE
jgi:zinc protease